MKDNKTKVITLAALIIAVIGLSIGFAAFASTLNIQTSASVSPEDGNFIVKFSRVNDTLNEQGVAPSLGTGDTAQINNTNASNPVISNLSARFTQPGQTVEYTFYVRNMGKYDAYLTDVEFNASSGGTFKTCIATGDNPVSSTIKNQVCNAITFTLTLEDTEEDIELTPSSNVAQLIGNDYIVSKSSTPQSGTTNSKMVKVRIEYPSSAPHADGSFEVEFGNVEMIFATLAGYIPSTPTPAPATSEVVVDDLALAPGKSVNKDGMYVVAASDNINIIYMEMDGIKMVSSNTIMWFVDEASANGYNAMMGTNFQANKWYTSEDGQTFYEYTGSSPISLSDFDDNEIYDQEYLERIIASFGN